MLRKNILITAFVLINFSRAFAQEIDSIRNLLDSTYAKTPFYGNVLITKNNQVLFEKSYGFADAVNKTPLTNQNSFQIASISKQFTAYGIMLLKNKGLLSYDSFVNCYISDFPYKNITVRHLLNHSSGLPNFWDGIRPNLDTSKSNGNQDVLNYLKQHQLPLQFTPGSQYQYADIGYDFLANIIENISGLSYQEFLSKNIFTPLKMNNTFAYMTTDIRRIQNKNLAIGHTLQNNNYVYAHLQSKYSFVYYLGDFYGDGSMVSSANDLAIWAQALKDCKLLPCEIQNESITESVYNNQILFVRNGLNISYGFGWFIIPKPSKKAVYHTGGHPGNSHIIYRLLDKDITLVFLSNTDAPFIKTLRGKIIQLLD